jgi:hypothetical protein
MITTRTSRTWALRAFVVILVAPLFVSCRFVAGVQSVCDAFNEVDNTPLISSSLSPVFDNPGTIAALHGSGFATLNTGSIIKVEQSVPVPLWATRAAVFLNGWRLGYGRVDHHVYTLGTMIGKIQASIDPNTKQSTLTWNALGWLKDKSGTASFDWTYDFTVLFWENSSLDADVDQGVVGAQGQYCNTADQTLTDNVTFQDNSGTSTALSSFFSFIQNIAFAASKTVTALPRGFGFLWSPNDDDHHLLQLGYNLDHSEMSVDSRTLYGSQHGLINAPVPIPPNTPPLTGATLAGSGFVSWNTYTLFKDNDARRDYKFGEIASGMGGNDVAIIQPPFSFLPQDAAGNCLQPGPLHKAEQFVIENVPFEYAVPMLTGWELEYPCEDHHVKEIGIGIVDWSYDPPAGGVGGTLHYTLISDLYDNSNNGGVSSHKVTVLGFRPITGADIKSGPLGR